MVSSFGPDSEWADVTPIFNSEVEDSVVPINYSQHFKEVFAYLRAALQKDERSERAFALTTDAADLNPANYTVWQYRRNLLKSLNKDLHTELKYCSGVIEDNPKNYQVWHHRRVLIEWMKEPSKELLFTDKILEEDSKNYHAWQHRQWVVQQFNLWDDELDYSVKLLKEDMRNNSAWNYRYFVISSTTGFTPEVVQREVQATLEFIHRAPHNESAWNYLNGILINSGPLAYPEIEEFCERLYGEEKCKANHLLAFMVDLAMGRIEKKEKTAENDKARARQLLEELVEVDPIRRNYWKSLQ